MVMFYFPNYGFAFIEAFFAFLFLTIIFHTIFKMFFKDEDLLIKIYKKGSALTWLIIFSGIAGLDSCPCIPPLMQTQRIAGGIPFRNAP